VAAISIIKNKIQPSPDDFLWKYMSFHKFLSFIIKQSFYYARLDQLEDGREGISQQHLSLLRFHRDNKLDGLLDPDHPSYKLWFDMGRLTKVEKKFVDFQKSNFVMCWFVNARESAGMWNLYSEPGGVAIKVKASALVEKLCVGSVNSKVGGKMELSYGNVEYKDFSDRWAMQEKRFLVKNPVYRKDLSFEHEKEFRASIRLDRPSDTPGIVQTLPSFDSFPFSILCHPRTQKWQMDNLSAVLEKFMPNKKALESELSLR
jgi:hypothetical protein